MIRRLPTRDLSLLPGHPVLVGAEAGNAGGVLIPVMCLIKGTYDHPRASVTDRHVAFDSHDILRAEGLPAESHIDGDDRAFFVEASTTPCTIPPSCSRAGKPDDRQHGDRTTKRGGRDPAAPIFHFKRSPTDLRRERLSP